MDSFMNALSDFLIHLTPGFMVEDPQKVRSPIYLVFVALFFASLVAGIIMATRARQLSKGNRLHRQIFERYGNWLGWLGGLGLVIVAMRYADVQLFSKRLWTLLDLFALLAVGTHFLVYWKRQYPAEIAAYRESERRGRHLPPAQRNRLLGQAVRPRRRVTR